MLLLRRILIAVLCLSTLPLAAQDKIKKGGGGAPRVQGKQEKILHHLTRDNFFSAQNMRTFTFKRIPR